MAIDQTQPLAVRQTGGGGLGNAAWQNAASGLKIPKVWWFGTVPGAQERRLQCSSCTDNH